MKSSFWAVLLLVSAICGGGWANDDWPQWRGPNRDDISKETGLLQEWPATGPTKLWSCNTAGLGYAGFAVVGDRLYTLGLFDGSEFGLCLDANSGKEIWRVKLGDEFQNKWGDGPRNTPTVDGDRVYFMDAQGDLVCAKAESGAQIWKASMKDFGGKVPFWGYAESPLVDDDGVICTPGGEQGSILALNKMTGEKLWQTADLSKLAHYASLIVFGSGKDKVYVQLLVDSVVGIRPADGKVEWKVEFPGNVAVIPTPVDAGGKIFVTSGYKAGSSLIRVSGGEAKELWHSRSMSNHHGGVIFLDGFVYGHGDGDGFACQNDKGDVVWSAEKKYQKGGVTYADGRFYYVEEGTGNVFLIAADSKGFEEKGKFKMEPQTEQRKPDGRIWVHPVVANGKLFVRDQEYIHCYDVKK